MKVLTLYALLVFPLMSVRSQEAQPAQEQSSQLMPSDRARSEAQESSSKPDAPVPKDDANSTCPDGIGKQCGLLSGHLYLGTTSLTQHNKTTWQALKNPYVALIGAAVIGSTIVDIEGTQACLRAGTCREGNPLYGSHPSRARMYGIAMPFDALGIYFMAKSKRDGQGVAMFATGMILSSVHLYFGLNAIADARNGRR